MNQSEVVIPWKSLNGPDLLGDDAFRQMLQAFKSEPDQNIPKRKQTLRHLPLAELAAQEKTRGEWMRKAYQEHGYTMQSIADFAGLHHSTVSRLIKQQDENARNKTLPQTH